MTARGGLTGHDMELFNLEREKTKALIQIAKMLTEYLPKIEGKLDMIQSELFEANNIRK